MAQSKKLMDRIALGVDLPGEYLPRVPVVEICDDSRVLIENHMGVIGYSCNEICAKVRFGVLKICGSQLSLARMSRHQLVIIGKIDGVALQRRNG